MANIASAKKRARQADKLRLHNNSQRSMLRTQIKKVVTAIANKDNTAAKEAYQMAVPLIDKTASKGIIHRNKAARHKSRLNGHIKAL